MGSWVRVPPRSPGFINSLRRNPLFSDRVIVLDRFRCSYPLIFSASLFGSRWETPPAKVCLPCSYYVLYSPVRNICDQRRVSFFWRPDLVMKEMQGYGVEA